MKAIYKCRSCGKEFCFCEVSEALVQVIEERIKCGIPVFLKEQISHECENGTDGIADLQEFKDADEK